MSQSGSITTDTLTNGNSVLLFLAVASVLAGLVAAAFAASGINRRLKEYS